MSNIMVKKENASLPVTQRPLEWEPFRMARELFRWDPFRELSAAWPTLEVAEFSPAFEVKETKDNYMFRADVPGVKEEDLEISRTGNRLMVSGKREAEKEDKGDKFYTYERSYGSFTRSFTMPEGIDIEHIQADLKDGVLTIYVPKKPEAQPQKISLKNILKKH